MSWDLDAGEARELAEEYLDAFDPLGDDRWVITDMTERDWGWIVRWSTERYAEGSREPGDVAVGGGPLLIDRKRCEVAVCGSTRPVDYWVEQWLRGDLDPVPRPPANVAADPWLDLQWDWSWRTQSRAAMVAELERELSRDHPLHGLAVSPVAKCGHCDDVAYQLTDGTFVLVHLTWTRKEERSPSPRWVSAADWAGLVDLMDAAPSLRRLASLPGVSRETPAANGRSQVLSAEVGSS